MLAAGFTDNVVTLNDCRTGKQIDSIPTHVSGVELLCFSPDNKTLLTASGRWVKLWSVTTRREMGYFEHSGNTIFASFAPDGNALVTADVNGSTRVWRVLQDQATLASRATISEDNDKLTR